MVTSISEKFWQSIGSIRDDIISMMKPVRGTVNELTEGKIILTRSINDPEDRDEATYPRIRGFDVNVGEDVYALSLGDGQQLLVLGALQNATPTAYTLNAPLGVTGAISTVGELSGDSADITSGLVAGTLTSLGDADIDGSLNVDGSAVVDGTLSVGGAVTAASFNSPFIHTEAQSSADTASTTNIVSTVGALSDAITLPTGIWTVYALGGLQVKHSVSGGNVQCSIQINTHEGTLRLIAAHNTVYTQMVAEDILTGQSGTITVYVRYKGSDSGTTSARNPWVTIIAVRTA